MFLQFNSHHSDAASEEESCSEDLEEAEHSFLKPSPNSSSLLSFTAIGKQGVVLEFASPDPSSNKMGSTESKPNSESTSLGAGAGVSVLQSSAGADQKAASNHLLSATVRKKVSKSAPSHREVSVQELMEAVRAENALVEESLGRTVKGGGEGGGKKEELSSTGANSGPNAARFVHSQPPSKPSGEHTLSGSSLAGNTTSLPDSKQLPKTSSGDDHITTPRSLLSGSPSSIEGAKALPLHSKQVETAPFSAPKLRDKPGFPTKPMLLNYDAYKQSKQASSAAATRAEEQQQAQGGLNVGSGGEGGLASSSLTEHTLKVITEKVRKMSSK